ncbi:SLAM family member 7 [Talpa occidentalis]|uniref:SLAM family member 7 n=1 Tax=Talpa occidentalis TaxID=50954 RepID=UPI0023F6BFDE|nr:SLAM family member 7 [Talpa occidentalis]
MLGFPACTILVCLLGQLCQLAEPAASEAPTELIGAFGGNVTFPLNDLPRQIDTIVWFFNSNTLLTIQPKDTQKPKDTFIVTESRNTGRVDFSSINYSLILKKLMKNDSGPYNVKIHSSSLQNPLIRHYRLRVYGHVSQPKVTPEHQSSENGSCVTNLTCSVDQEDEGVTYSWISLEEANNEVHNGPVISISWRREEWNRTYKCVARNPVSNSSSNPIAAWKLCTGAIGKPLSFEVLGVILTVALLLLVLVIFVIHQKRKKESTGEEKGTGVHHGVPSHGHTPGEVPEYDTVTFPPNTVPEKNSPNTLYFTVQIPKKVDKPHTLPETAHTPRSFAFEKVI